MNLSHRRHAFAAGLLLVLLLSGCLPGSNPMQGQGGSGTEPAGFWLGLWHGIIIWVSFFLSLFKNNVSVYEVHNSGWTYNLGFVLGAATFHGGGGAAGSRSRSKEGRA